MQDASHFSDVVCSLWPRQPRRHVAKPALRLAKRDHIRQLPLTPGPFCAASSTSRLPRLDCFDTRRGRARSLVRGVVVSPANRSGTERPGEPREGHIPASVWPVLGAAWRRSSLPRGADYSSGKGEEKQCERQTRWILRTPRVLPRWRASGSRRRCSSSRSRSPCGSRCGAARTSSSKHLSRRLTSLHLSRARASPRGLYPVGGMVAFARCDTVRSGRT